MCLDRGDSLNTKTKTPIDDVISVYAGGGDNLLLKSNGTVLGLGVNYYGELGTNQGQYQDYAYQVQGLDNVIRLSVSVDSPNNQHMLALKKDGTVWTWGTNEYGQLGNGTKISKFEQL